MMKIIEQDSFYLQKTMTGQAADTIVDLALSHADNIGNRQFITWLEHGKTESGSFTFSQLDSNAKNLAMQLSKTLLEINSKEKSEQNLQTILIVLQPGLDFVIAFFACLYAGIAAVPAYPLKTNEAGERLSKLIDASGAKIALTGSKSMLAINSNKKLRSKVEYMLVEQRNECYVDMWQRPDIDSHSIAFIQYTSGSTGDPKGVMVSHDNLLSNQKMIAEAMNTHSDCVIVGWLPLFHDMGLIGNLLQPFCLGARCILMSPTSFVMNPIRWLEAISKYKATISGGPNFAYELCLSRTTEEQRRNLNLDSWKIAFNGAEKIRAETLEKFSNTFSKYGFSADAFFPCYGMAESTLFISGVDHKKAPTILTVDKNELLIDNIRIKKQRTVGHSNNSLIDHEIDQTVTDDNNIASFVSCGVTYQSCQFKIVDQYTHTECAENKVGEIWVTAGSHISRGYNNDIELSKATFNKVIAGHTNNPGYLRTGDLGFFHQGELYVAGRIKDLIIIKGRNHYPHDLELTAVNADPLINESISAAFPIDSNGEERLIVIVEIKKRLIGYLDIDAVKQSIKRAISIHHAVQVKEVVLIRSRIPMTSSGKIQRRKCCQLYIQDKLDII